MEMKRTDFYYDLPQELIAQEPLEPRDHSRLLVLDRASGTHEDRHFYDVEELLRPGDCLILNDSRVLPARLLGQRVGTGAAVELLLLTPHGGDVWEVLAGPGRRAKPGYQLTFGDGLLNAEVLEVLEDGSVVQKKYVDVKFVLDERICDGFYYATFFKYYKRLMAHPEILDLPPEEVVKDID